MSVSVPVRLDPGEDLTPECVRADVIYGEDKLPASVVQVQLRDAAGSVDRTREPVVVIRSNRLINEPVVMVYVSVGCSPQITRKLVLLVDPPDVAQPKSTALTSPVEAVPVQPLKMVQDPVSRVGMLGKKAPSFTLTDGASRPGHAVSGKDKAQRKKGRQSSAHGKLAHAVESAKLELDPVAVDATVAPGLQMSEGLGALPAESDASSPELQSKRRAAAALWQAMNASPEELARDRQRLDEVERRLETLGRDNARASEAVSGLQTRLAQQSGRGNLVYALGMAVLALLGLMAWREWHVRKALARQSTWLNSRSPVDSGLEESEDTGAVEPLASIEQVLAEADQAPSSAPIGQSAEAMRADPPAAPQLPTPAPAPAPAPRREGLRDVSIEELIDLEQQAEFFVVLGQEESAIDVLESYIRQTTAASPMPFLKLLEIYRRLGMRADYERTRANFNLQFNAHAPLWESDPSHGHELKDYPGVVERIQSLWSHPDQALEVLERSLMRQDNESYTFDLPAYRDLLLLYSILRDLVEHDSQGYIDGGARHPSTLSADLDTESPLMATLPMKALPELAPTLSLDLELDDLDVQPHPERNQRP
ncbi:MAG TPA: hypothetical protein VFM48_16140 [Aquabacterium sp.]|nr:hypothetical protein [Aquabacterium sp.]